jgi:prepilin-type N-terminal cleavage/methylation domain-containing protein
MRQRVQDLRTRKADDGFTLVELLIVIVVLGILAGIVVFGVANFKGQADTAACKANVKTVQVAIDAYSATNPGFPTLDELVAGNYIKTKPAGVTITNGVASSTACAAA